MRTSNPKSRDLALLLITAGATMASGCTFMNVANGEVGVLWTTSGVSDHVYPEGLYTVGVLDRPTVYTARSQERDEQLDVLAANGLRIVLDASIRYHAIGTEIVALDRELGPQYYSSLIGPTLRSQARRVVGRYQPEEIYSTKREIIEREIREGIEKVIEGRHVVLEAVLVRNVQLPEAIQAAINNKLEAEQQSLKMKYVIDKTRQETEQRLIEANAESQRDLIRAKADAESKRIGAQATADYEKLIQQNVTDQVLRWQEIDAFNNLAKSPNAKVIVLGGGKGSTPLLEVK
jgi:regulator of protease activity HflC (stomatin/prohibitin superfamily)